MSSEKNTVAAAPAAGALERGGIVTISLVIFCQSFQALTIGGLALFLPLIRGDLNLSFSDGGLLSAAATFTYALGQIPAGYLSDRFGPKRLFFIGLAGSMLLSLNFGMIHSFHAALVNQAVSGVFRALLFAPGLLLISSWFPPQRRATAMGLYVAGGFSGSIFLSLFGPLLVVHYGWRFCFILFSLIGLGAAFLYLSYAREKRAAAGREATRILDVFQLFKYKIMWVCGAIQFIRLAVVLGFNFWLPSLLVADRGLSLQHAGFVVGMCAALTVPANTLGGYVSDRIRNPPLVIGGSLAILACTSVLLVLAHSIPALLVVTAINAVFIQFYFGPLFLVPIEVLGPRIAGISTGFSNMFANLGALTAVYALGVVKDQAGSFNAGFYALSGACAIGVALSIALARMRTAALAKL